MDVQITNCDNKIRKKQSASSLLYYQLTILHYFAYIKIVMDRKYLQIDFRKVSFSNASLSAILIEC